MGNLIPAGYLSGFPLWGRTLALFDEASLSLRVIGIEEPEFSSTDLHSKPCRENLQLFPIFSHGAPGEIYPPFLQLSNNGVVV